MNGFQNAHFFAVERFYACRDAARHPRSRHGCRPWHRQCFAPRSCHLLLQTAWSTVASMYIEMLASSLHLYLLLSSFRYASWVLAHGLTLSHLRSASHSVIAVLLFRDLIRSENIVYMVPARGCRDNGIYRTLSHPTWEIANSTARLAPALCCTHPPAPPGLGRMHSVESVHTQGLARAKSRTQGSGQCTPARAEKNPSCLTRGLIQKRTRLHFCLTLK